MVGNDQTPPVPGYGTRPNTGAQPGSLPAYGPTTGSVYGQAYAAPAGQAAGTTQPPPAPTYANPLLAQPAAPAAGMPAQTPAGPPAQGVAPPAPAIQAKVTDESDRPDSGDDIWIERTKRAIAETQNDPYRQVQLLQHLNKLYLKERFGREVQADKG